MKGTQPVGASFLCRPHVPFRLHGNELLPFLGGRGYSDAMIADGLSDQNSLAGLDLFHGLAPAALDDVGARVRFRAYELGAKIFDQGDPVERAHILIKGGVRIAQAGSDGAQVVIRFIGPGELFGSVALYTDQRYPADAVAMSDCVEASCSHNDLIVLMDRHSRIATNMIAIIGQRIAELQNRVRELATQSVERRIANTVLRLARSSGQAVAEGTAIGFAMRRKDIADISGTTLHTASRTLSKWSKQGLVISKHQQLTLCSIPDIERIAEF